MFTWKTIHFSASKAKRTPNTFLADSKEPSFVKPRSFTQSYFKVPPTQSLRYWETYTGEYRFLSSSRLDFEGLSLKSVGKTSARRSTEFTIFGEEKKGKPQTEISHRPKTTLWEIGERLGKSSSLWRFVRTSFNFFGCELNGVGKGGWPVWLARRIYSDWGNVCEIRGKNLNFRLIET